MMAPPHMTILSFCAYVCVRVCVSHRVSFSFCMFCNTPVVWALSVVFRLVLIEFDTDGGCYTACFNHGHSVLVPQVQSRF